MIVSPEKALNEILKSHNTELLELKKFQDLKTLAEQGRAIEDTEYEMD